MKTKKWKKKQLNGLKKMKNKKMKKMRNMKKGKFINTKNSKLASIDRPPLSNIVSSIFGVSLNFSIKIVRTVDLSTPFDNFA